METVVPREDYEALRRQLQQTEAKAAADHLQLQQEITTLQVTLLKKLQNILCLYNVPSTTHPTANLRPATPTS